MHQQDHEPTYEELRAERAREWNEKQGIAARAQAELHASILKMPDVANAPSPDLPYSHRGVTCRGCQTDVFRVERYVTVNGVKHRAELHCLACGEAATWDYHLNRWIEDVLLEDAKQKIKAGR